jgi:hypothetical protein
MGLKHTMKLVKKVLNDDDKNVLYTDEELMYMRRQLGQMKEERKLRKLQKKQQQGFGYDKRETDQPHDGGG